MLEPKCRCWTKDGDGIDICFTIDKDFWNDPSRIYGLTIDRVEICTGFQDATGRELYENDFVTSMNRTYMVGWKKDIGGWYATIVGELVEESIPLYRLLTLGRVDYVGNLTENREYLNIIKRRDNEETKRDNRGHNS